MKVICAWCDKEIRQGSDSLQVSHGICPACSSVFEASLAARWPATRRRRGRRVRHVGHPTLPLPGFLEV